MEDGRGGCFEYGREDKRKIKQEDVKNGRLLHIFACPVPAILCSMCVGVKIVRACLLFKDGSVMLLMLLVWKCCRSFNRCQSHPLRLESTRHPLNCKVPNADAPLDNAAVSSRPTYYIHQYTIFQGYYSRIV